MQHVSMEKSEIKELPGRRMWMLYNPADHGAKDLSVCYIEIPEGQAALPPHVHEKSTEFIYITAGAGHIVVCGRRVDLKETDGILVESGEEHALYNDGAQKLCALCSFVPPSVPEEYLELK